MDDSTHGLVKQFRKELEAAMKAIRAQRLENMRSIWRESWQARRARARLQRREHDDRT